MNECQEQRSDVCNERKQQLSESAWELNSCRRSRCGRDDIHFFVIFVKMQILSQMCSSEDEPDCVLGSENNIHRVDVRDRRCVQPIVW